MELQGLRLQQKTINVTDGETTTEDAALSVN